MWAHSWTWAVWSMSGIPNGGHPTLFSGKWSGTVLAPYFGFIFIFACVRGSYTEWWLEMSGFTLNERHKICCQENKIRSCSCAICFLSISFQFHVKLVVWCPQENGYSFVWGSYIWTGRALHLSPRSKEIISSSHSHVFRISPLPPPFLFHKLYLHSQALPQNRHFLSSPFWPERRSPSTILLSHLPAKTVECELMASSAKGSSPKPLVWVCLECPLVQPALALGVQDCLSLSSSITQYSSVISVLYLNSELLGAHPVLFFCDCTVPHKMGYCFMACALQHGHKANTEY